MRLVLGVAENMKNKTYPTSVFNQKLLNYLSTLESEFDQIPRERKNKLEELSTYISGKSRIGEPVNITVICTHNSRRSHMGQLWLKVASIFYGIKNVRTFSGGTEATAFYESAVNAMKRVGFDIELMEKSANPIYECLLGKGIPKIKMFSKKYDHFENPSQGFAAIMVCTEADEACPFIPGADVRFSIPYFDPKAFDGTPKEMHAYDERCRQIAREMFYSVKMAGINVELDS